MLQRQPGVSFLDVVELLAEDGLQLLLPTLGLGDDMVQQNGVSHQSIHLLRNLGAFVRTHRFVGAEVLAQEAVEGQPVLALLQLSFEGIQDGDDMISYESVHSSYITRVNQPGDAFFWYHEGHFWSSSLIHRIYWVSWGIAPEIPLTEFEGCSKHIIILLMNNTPKDS